jgi:hypothetical protein
MRVKDLINRGRPFTGSSLQRAIEIAGQPPLGGPGVIIESTGSQSLQRSADGAQIRGGKDIVAILRTAVNTIVPTIWNYPYDEAEITSGLSFTVKANGKSSDDTNRPQARNLAEYLNTSAFALYGILLRQTEITITVRPIPPGQPVVLREVKTTDGQITTWFEALNPIDVECAEPLVATATGTLALLTSVPSAEIQGLGADLGID